MRFAAHVISNGLPEGIAHTHAQLKTQEVFICAGAAAGRCATVGAAVFIDQLDEDDRAFFAREGVLPISVDRQDAQGHKIGLQHGLHKRSDLLGFAGHGFKLS